MFALTEANAIDAATTALTALDQLTSGETARFAARALAQFNGRPVTVSCGPTNTIPPPGTFSITLVDRDGNLLVSPGDDVSFGPGSCNGIAREIKLAVTAFTGFGDTVEGRVEFDVTFSVPAFSAKGGYTFAYNTLPGGGYHWRASDVSLQLTFGTAIETVTATLVDKIVDAQNQYQIQLVGRVESDRLDGAFDISTPVHFAGTVGSLPTSGELELRALASRVRVTPAAGTAQTTEANYAVDPTGTGQYGPAQQVAWTVLQRGSVFGYLPNTAPKITSLTLEPAQPTADAPLSALYTATDAEFNPLQATFEWQRNGVVIPGITESVLWTDNFQRGDVITAKLTVSDGRASTTATVSTTILNSPPRLVSPVLAPASAYTTDDLSFSGTPTDADNDPLQTTYAWLRNGVPIAGQTSATLPASETTRDDEITVVVTVSDGADAVTFELSRTILDSPPQLVVANVPSVVSYGDLVSFTASITDADNDPIPPGAIRVVGPTGMTVDPATGVVSWLAETPMFDNVLDVSFSLSLEGSAAPPSSGTIRIEDPARNYAFFRTGFEAPRWPSGLSVGDFDDDGDDEALILSDRSLYELATDGAGGYRQVWAYPFAFNEQLPASFSEPNAKAIATGDVNNDGRDEIFVAGRELVLRLDGVTRRVVDTVSLPQYSYCYDLQFADLDSDGAAELVCALYGTTLGELLVYAAGDLTLRHQFAAADYGQTITVGNADNDAALEIVTASGYVFDGASYVNEWLYGPGFGVDVAVGNVDGSGVAEIVATTGSAVRAYSATLKSPLWEFAADSSTSLTIVDVGGTATPEMIVGGFSFSDSVTAYRYNAATPSSPDVVFALPYQDFGMTQIGIGDLDGDSGLEFIFGTGTGHTGKDRLIVAGGTPAAIEWTNVDPSQLDGPFVGGDLVASAVVAPAPVFATASTDSGYTGTRLVTLDPDDGLLTVSAEVGSNWNGRAALAVADYDADGTDEVFLSTAQLYDGYFTAYDFFSDTSEWVSPRLSTQQTGFGVVAADITGDGREDLVALTGGGIVYVHDVFSQTLAWQSTTLGNGRDVLVHDLDGNGTPEIIVVGQSIYVYSRAAGTPLTYLQTGLYTPPATPNDLEVRDAAIADLDGDGDVEIAVLLTPSYTFSLQSSVRVLDASLQPIGSFDLGWRADSIEVEASVHGRKNLVLPSSGEFSYLGTEGGRLNVVDARTGALVWRSPLLVGNVTPNGIRFVDVAGNGSLRLSVGTRAGMYLTR